MSEKPVFPLRCILQPALLLAYISVFSVPTAFALLPEELAGVLMGTGLITSSVARFRAINEMKTERARIGLDQPLLGSRKRKEYIISSTVLVFAVTALVVELLFVKAEYGGAVVLAASLMGTSPSKHYFQAGILGILLSAGLVYSDYWPCVDGYIAALTSGYMFQVVALDCLSLWDHVHQSPLGFNLSSMALVTLFVAATTLEIVS